MLELGGMGRVKENPNLAAKGGCKIAIKEP